MPGNYYFAFVLFKLIKSFSSTNYSPSLFSLVLASRSALIEIRSYLSKIRLKPEYCNFIILNRLYFCSGCYHFPFQSKEDFEHKIIKFLVGDILPVLVRCSKFYKQQIYIKIWAMYTEEIKRRKSNAFFEMKTINAQNEQ